MEPFEAVLTRWAAAEASGDTAVLAALLDADFHGDGPAGTVLDRAGWLDLHRTRALVRGAFAWYPTGLHVERTAAIAEGVQTQIARHRGADWSGTFACTLVALPVGGSWRIVNVQLSERIAQDQPLRAFEIGQVADVLRAALYERGGHGDHHH